MSRQGDTTAASGGRTRLQHHAKAGYEIRLRGRLDPRWSAWFDGMTVSSDSGDTVLTVPAIDQPGLRGMLNRIWDLNLTLVSVGRLAEGEGGGEP